MLSSAEIDDFVFEPCGYSMNGCDGKGFSTIHVTPEEGFSYASLELTGYPAKGVDPSALVSKVTLDYLLELIHSLGIRPQGLGPILICIILSALLMS